MDRSANVVLTADTSGYQQSLQSAHQETERLTKTIDAVTGSLDRLSKSAGRKLQILGAADIAAFSGATAAFASYEEQMQGLAAQSQALSKNFDSGRQAFDKYQTAVKNLRQELPVTTRELSDLMMVITKITGSSKNIQSLSETFVKLSATTGESVSSLSNSVLGFQRTMGASMDPKVVDRYANTVNTLAASTNASAVAIADFGSQIGPMAKQLGIGATDVLGFSSAFMRAGQDGYTAANAFSKMMQDISYATQSGSPELSKYASLIGVTVERFKEMDQGNAMIKIVENLNRMGPAAINVLNRLGLDGIRTVRALTAVSQQSGGLAGGVADARAAYATGTGPDSGLNRGSKEVFGGVADAFTKLGGQIKMLTETMGKFVAGPIEGIAKGLTKVVQMAQAFADSPIGKLAGWAASTIGPIALLTGTLLTMAAALAKVASIGFFVRGSGVQGFMDASRGIRYGGADASGQRMYHALPGAQVNKLSQTGQSIMAGRGNWFQTPMYAAGVRAGGMIPYVSGGPSFQSRLAGMPFAAGRVGLNLLSEMYAPIQTHMPHSTGPGPYAWGVRSGGFDATQRPRLFNAARFSDYRFAAAGMNYWDNARNAMGFGRPPIGPATGPMPMHGPLTQQQAAAASARSGSGIWRGLQAFGMAGLGASDDALKKILTGRDQGVAQASTALKNLGGSAGDANKGMKSWTLGTQGIGKELAGSSKAMGRFTVALAAAAAGVARFSGQMMMGMGKAALGALGSPLGGMLAVMGGFMAYDHYKDKSEQGQEEDPTSIGLEYFKQTGLASLSQYGTEDLLALSMPKEPQDPKTKKKAWEVSEKDVAFASLPGRDLSNPAIADATSGEVINLLGSEMQMASNITPGYIQALKTDLIDEYGPIRALEVLKDIKTKDPNDFDFSTTFKAVDTEYTEIADKERALDWMNAQIEQRTGSAMAIGGKDAGYEVWRSDLVSQLEGLAEATYEGSDTFVRQDMEEIIENLNKVYLGDENYENEFGAKRLIESYAKYGVESTLPGGDSSVVAPWADLDTLKKFVIREYLSEGLNAEDDIRSDFLSSLGLDPALSNKEARYEILGSSASALNFKGVQNIQEDFIEQYTKNSPLQRLFTRGESGREILEAYGAEGDLNQQAEAIKAFMGSAKDANFSLNELNNRLGQLAARGGTTADAMYGLIKAFQSAAQQKMQFQLPYMSREGRVEAVQENFLMARRLKQMDENNDPATQEEFQTALAQKEAIKQEQYQFYRAIVVAEHQLSIQQERAQEDFAQQREWAEFDFNLSRERQDHQYYLSRSRAEEDFQIQRARASRNFHIQETRAVDDFERSRRRQMEDRRHQVELMAEQASQSMYNIYERVPVQRTWAAESLAVNAREQLIDLRGMVRNLNKLRQLGVSDDTIQQLDLTNPANAQQLERFVNDLQGQPGLVRRYNRMIERRLSVSRKLVTDESNKDWEEFNYQFELALKRGAEDFHRAMARSRNDFSRSMGQQADDFQRMMRRQAADYSLSVDQAVEDHERGMERQVIQFDKQMDRAHEDLLEMANEVTHGFNNTVERGMEILGKNGDKWLAKWNDITDKTVNKAISMKTRLASVFGLDFKWDSSANGTSQATPGLGDFNKDTKTGGGSAPSGSMGTIGRKGSSPPFTAADMIREASSGGGSAGKVAGSGVKKGENDSAGAQTDSSGRSIFDLAAQMMDANNYVQPTNPVVVGYNPYGTIDAGYSAGYHTGEDYDGEAGDGIYAVLPGVVDSAYYGNHGSAYGNLTALYHGDYHGNRVESWYAHQNQMGVSRGDVVDAGARIGSMGSTGHSSGSHLHLEVRINGNDVNPRQFLGSGTISGQHGGGISGGGFGQPQITFAEEFPEVEKAATAVGMPKGFMSTKLNEMAFQYAAKTAKRLGVANPLVGGAGSVGNMPFEYNPNASVEQWRDEVVAMMQQLGRKHPDKSIVDLVLRQISNESGGNPKIVNKWDSNWQAGHPSVGLMQVIEGTFNAYAGPYKNTGPFSYGVSTNPYANIYAGLNYARATYGNWHNAFIAGDGYRDGSVFTGGAKPIVVGEGGPEMVLPLNSRGANFLADMMERLIPRGDARVVNTAGRSVPMSCTHNSYTRVDRSTQFTGPINVKAEDPNQFLSRMEQVKRLNALTQPALNRSS